MKGFVIAAYSEEGELEGYYNGEEKIGNTDLALAEFFDDSSKARTGMGNLQRRMTSVELRLIFVEKTITISSSS